MLEPNPPNHAQETTGDREAELRRAMDRRAPGILREFLAFLRQNKKWWLLPLILTLLLVGFFVVLSSSAVAPLIYTLF
jgi:hypothetical protein